MKTCKTCNETLANSKFGKDKRTNDGLSPRCSRCRGVALPGASEKRCVMCLEEKSLDDFHRDLNAPDLRRKVCKKCGTTAARSWNKRNKTRFNENLNEWRKANKENTKATQRRSHLKITYNLTEEEYWEMFDSQGGVCAICGRASRHKNLSVDHDHSCCSGKKSCGKCVRGLLCQTCNRRILPTFDYNPQALANLNTYLSKEKPE